MAKRSSSDTVDMGLRVKENLRARIERAAKKSGVSMNSEIVQRLDRSFEDDDSRSAAKVAIKRMQDAEGLVEKMGKRLENIMSSRPNQKFGKPSRRRPR